jgi:tRNA threonylcarbamoyladenosine biosynthesis protein TsaB
MSLALHDGRSLLAEQTWHTHNNHSLQLGPALEALLAQHSVTAEQISVLAVCTGPGSYSGLRVGVSFAKGIASARHAPLIGISSLDIIAAGQPHYPNSLIAVVQAGRGRVAVGRYQWRKGRWMPRGEAQLMNWETLLDSIDGPAHVSGEINDEGRERLRQAQERDVPVTLVPAALRLRRAGFLAQEAWDLFHNGDLIDFEAARLVPFYIKTQDAPET